MYWTKEHDRLMCRDILVVDPITGTKKGTVQRGSKWKIRADHLLEIIEPKFKVDSRAVIATSFWLKNSERSLKVRRKPVV